MAYVNLKNTTVDKYDQIIYSGDAKYKIKITFNGKELENADTYLEKMVRSSRLLPDDSSKRFSLDNFVAQTIQLTLHDIDTSTIQEPINISLGTLVDSAKNIYEYVPLGVFNIQEKPTTDKGVTTLKLIDNRVKFDTPYDGSVLIKANNGSVTKKQVLDDICKSVGVANDITTFLGEDDKLGIYDNTIKATTYVSYMMEQAGCFAIITREGHLGKVELNNLATHRIPSSIVEENYSKEKDKSFKVERVVYEDAIRKYDSNTDTNVDGSKLQTLYLNAANPYISSQEQVENIFAKLKNFEINSVVTQRVMGNPRIDPWDIIEVYDYYSKAEPEPVLFRTLANQEMTYTGVLLTTYKTEIGTEAQKENVTITGAAVMKKWAKTEIDNINADIKLQAGKIDETSSKVSQLEISSDKISSRLQNISDLTVNNEGYAAKLSFTNINQGSPVEIRIHPIFTDISYIYPGLNLFPSKTTYLKIRDLVFTNTKTNEVFRYTLPMDLWYLDENYDEFILDYTKQECKIIQRVGWKNVPDELSINTPQKYKLEKEVVHTFDFPNLYLTDGDYEISLPGYKYAYIYAKLMIQNEYTKQFATKVELNSSITQLDNSITLEVNGKYEDAKKEIDKKADDEEVNNKFKTVDENITAQLALKVDKDDNDRIVSMINASANIIHLKSNRFIVESDNLNITETGKLTCTEGKIGNMVISDNSFYLPITSDNEITQDEYEDFGKRRFDTPTEEDLKKFDTNNDGKVSSSEYDNVGIKGAKRNITKNTPGKMELKNNKIYSGLYFYDGNGKIAAEHTLQSSAYYSKNFNYETKIFEDTRAVYSANGINLKLGNKARFDVSKNNNTLLIGAVNGYDNKEFCLMKFQLDSERSEATYFNFQIGDVGYYITSDGITRTIFYKENDFQDTYTYIYGYGIQQLNLRSGNKNYIEFLNTKSNSLWGIDIWESDKKLKKNIKNTSSVASNIIKKIPHYSFDWKENNEHTECGYIAQDMEKINEDFVLKIKQQNGDYNYQISESGIIPYITKSLQEVLEKIDKLEEKISDIENRL